MPTSLSSDVEDRLADPAPGRGAGTDPNLLILGPDNFEQNEFLANAKFLGSAAAINVPNLAIFPNAFEHRFVVADHDWFRVVAEKTGTLDFQVYHQLYRGRCGEHSRRRRSRHRGLRRRRHADRRQRRLRHEQRSHSAGHRQRQRRPQRRRARPHPRRPGPDLLPARLWQPDQRGQWLQPHGPQHARPVPYGLELDDNIALAPS